MSRVFSLKLQWRWGVEGGQTAREGKGSEVRGQKGNSPTGLYQYRLKVIFSLVDVCQNKV